MEQLSFIVSSIVFVHLFLSKLVGLVKMWILYPFDAANGQSACSLVKFHRYILVLNGRRTKFQNVYSDFISGMIARHWVPVCWKRDRYKIKTNTRCNHLTANDCAILYCWVGCPFVLMKFMGDHSHKSYRAVLSSIVLCIALNEVTLNFESTYKNCLLSTSLM